MDLEPYLIKAPDDPDGLQGRLLHSQLSSLNVQLIPDRVFARRAFLDLIGLLPTATELDEFIKMNHFVNMLKIRARQRQTRA